LGSKILTFYFIRIQFVANPFLPGLGLCTRNTLGLPIAKIAERQLLISLSPLATSEISPLLLMHDTHHLRNRRILGDI
jgi:hypothetical protein